jgi:hypothetical protein
VVYNLQYCKPRGIPSGLQYCKPQGIPSGMNNQVYVTYFQSSYIGLMMTQ